MAAQEIPISCLESCGVLCFFVTYLQFTLDSPRVLSQEIWVDTPPFPYAPSVSKKINIVKISHVIVVVWWLNILLKVHSSPQNKLLMEGKRLSCNNDNRTAPVTAA
jgi:hypothetical protein